MRLRFKVFWFSKDKPTGHSERKKEKEEEADKRGKTISKNGQEWTLPAQLGQLKTGQDEKRLLRIYLWKRIEWNCLGKQLEVIKIVSICKRIDKN